MNRKGPADYHAIGRLRGASWLGPVVQNANERTEWKCRRCGRCWWAIYNSLKRGTACPMCGIIKRSRAQAKKPIDYRQMAVSRGVLRLGPTVRRTGSKTRWRCSHGHVWQACYDKIRDGRGCPACARSELIARSLQQRHPPEQYRALAAVRSLIWRGPEVTNAHAKTGWQCTLAKHRWLTSYHKVRQGRGCPRCALKRRADFFRHVPSDYQALASERGFTWIGPRVLTVAKKTWWRCPRGHSWRATYNLIHQGHGCHICQDRVNGRIVSAVQRRLCRRLGGRLNVRVGRYHVDVALERSGIQIAVEFDAWYFHGHRQEADEKRDEELIAAGWRVLRIRSASTHLPTLLELNARIERLISAETRVIITLPGWEEGPTLIS